ncbi:hypothetical protein V0R37_23070, partial [Pollutimonas sp. H1-120]
RTFQIAHEFSQMSALENLMMVPPHQAGESLFNTWFEPGLVRQQFLLAAREVARQLIAHVVQAHEVDDFQRSLAHLGLLLA